MEQHAASVEGACGESTYLLQPEKENSTADPIFLAQGSVVGATAASSLQLLLWLDLSDRVHVVVRLNQQQTFALAVRERTASHGRRILISRAARVKKCQPVVRGDSQKTHRNITTHTLRLLLAYSVPHHHGF